MTGAGARVRVGIGLVTAQVPPDSPRTPADEYAGTLRIAERAEQLGFDSLWTSEHHGVSDGYLPSPLVLLSAVAAVTGRIRLGTGVLIAPAHVLPRLHETLNERGAADDLRVPVLRDHAGPGRRPA